MGLIAGMCLAPAENRSRISGPFSPVVIRCGYCDLPTHVTKEIQCFLACCVNKCNRKFRKGPRRSFTLHGTGPVNDQSYWACLGLYPSSCMWKTKDHNVSETGSVSFLRWMGQDKPIQWGPLERASLNHWTNPGP
jgi:hypothetical protein